jgi:hypothetical protein
VKPLFALLVLLLGGGLVWLAVAGRDDPAPPSRTPATASGGEHVAGDDQARLAGAPGEPQPAGPAAGDDARAFHLRGVVVDGEDRPCADAAVRCEIGGRAVDAFTTDAAGRFALRFPAPAGDGLLYGLLAARGEPGVALRSVVLRPDPAWPNATVRLRQDLGRIVLRPLEPFDVQVVSTCADAPPARLRFRHATFHDGPDHLVVGTDAAGHAAIEGLHAGTWRVVAVAAGCGRGTAFFRLPLADPGPVEVAMGPSRTVAVEVVDRETGEPLPGAVLTVRERLDRPDGIAYADYVPALSPAPTDAEGRTAITGVAEADVLRVRAEAPGYPAPSGRLRNSPGAADVPAGATSVRLELVAVRTVSWPVGDGEVPAPPEGTVLRLRPAPGARDPEVPPTGRIEQGRVVAQGWGAGPAHALAEAPGGSLAALYAGRDATEGPTVFFTKPRSVEVRLTYPDGEPAKGFRVVVANLGNNDLHVPVPTDAEGVARIHGLYAAPPGLPALVDVKAAAGPGSASAVPIGTLDLSTGDALLEATVERLRDVVLHVRLDGEPGLPPSFLVRLGGDWFRGDDFQRDSARGTLRCRWRPAGAGGATFLEIDAPGYLPIQTQAVVPAAPAAIEATLDLVRGGRVLAKIAPPPGGFHRLQLQAWDAAADRWELAFAGMPGVRPPDQANAQGEVLYPPVHPGRYRVVESALGIPSEPVEVVAGDEPARVHLDLSDVVVAKGRVELPEGVPFQGVVIRAEGIDEPLASNRMQGQPRTRWVSTGAREDGTFELRIPGDREVTLVPYANFLRPAADGGRAVVRGAEADVVLRLEEAPVATFAYDRDPAFHVNPGKPRTLPVLLYAGEPTGPPAHRLPALLEGRQARISGWVPGTWTVWIDAQPFAPVVLRGVELGDEDVDLGEIATSDGSSFVARLVREEGKELPRLSAFVVREGEPHYVRSVQAWKQAEVRVSGLGPGRFRVYVHADPVGPSLDEVIEFDGQADVERTLGP